MNQKLFTKHDVKQIKKMGSSPDEVLSQLQKFREGIRFSQLNRPATVSDGIWRFSKKKKDMLFKTFEKAKKNLQLIKFLPASGAATRMFRIPLYFLSKPEKLNALERDTLVKNLSAEQKFMKTFFQGIKNNKFPFTNQLKNILTSKNLTLDSVLRPGKSKIILEYLLTPAGLNYSNLPKALIPFHSYGNLHRTPLEEHLVEGSEYARGKNGLVRIHLTVAEELTGIFENFIKYTVPRYETRNRKYQVSYSIQDPSTNTVAADRQNNLFRDHRQHIVFRQGGHGALLENLNRLEEDIIFITNIDNVVPDRLKPKVIFYKKVLAGYLLELQDQIFKFLNQISVHLQDPATIHHIQLFCEKKLLIPFPVNFPEWDINKKAAFLFEKLNRPIRVCGMVFNKGEPGGGPFWVRDNENQESLQIVEKAQVDLDSKEQSCIFSASTHFNPVDLVCGIRNFRGEKFHLPDFIDPETYFITEKSIDGIPLKALELPGLWNGSMADWITQFVEVPILTFNPVKTINDLLKPKHQPARQG